MADSSFDYLGDSVVDFDICLFFFSFAVVEAVYVSSFWAT